MTRRTGGKPSRPGSPATATRPTRAALPGCRARSPWWAVDEDGGRAMAREPGEPGRPTTVGVVGLGTMGAGIVEVFARSGLDVVAVEADEAGLDRGRAHLERSTGRAVSRGRLTEADRDVLLG